MHHPAYSNLNAFNMSPAPNFDRACNNAVPPVVGSQRNVLGRLTLMIEAGF